MKKEYRQPNICALDFEILDLILASGGEDVGGNTDWDDWGWEDGFNGGYDTMGF